MKAILCRRFGTADDLVLDEVPDPVARPGEVVAKVASAGLNFFDTLIIAGKYQVKPPFPFSPQDAMEFMQRMWNPLGVPISPEIATHIYVAILTDTDLFHFSSISPRTFDICRMLLEAGVEPVRVARSVFDSSIAISSPSAALTATIVTVTLVPSIVMARPRRGSRVGWWRGPARRRHMDGFRSTRRHRRSPR